jgi:hypothetical protein
MRRLLVLVLVVVGLAAPAAAQAADPVAPDCSGMTVGACYAAAQAAGFAHFGARAVGATCDVDPGCWGDNPPAVVGQLSHYPGSQAVTYPPAGQTAASYGDALSFQMIYVVADNAPGLVYGLSPWYGSASGCYCFTVGNEPPAFAADVAAYSGAPSGPPGLSGLADGVDTLTAFFYAALAGLLALAVACYIVGWVRRRVAAGGR